MSKTLPRNNQIHTLSEKVKGSGKMIAQALTIPPITIAKKTYSNEVMLEENEERAHTHTGRQPDTNTAHNVN